MARIQTDRLHNKKTRSRSIIPCRLGYNHSKNIAKQIYTVYYPYFTNKNIRKTLKRYSTYQQTDEGATNRALQLVPCSTSNLGIHGISPEQNSGSFLYFRIFHIPCEITQNFAEFRIILYCIIRQNFAEFRAFFMYRNSYIIKGTHLKPPAVQTCPGRCSSGPCFANTRCNTGHRSVDKSGSRTGAAQPFSVDTSRGSSGSCGVQTHIQGQHWLLQCRHDQVQLRPLWCRHFRPSLAPPAQAPVVQKCSGAAQAPLVQTKSRCSSGLYGVDIGALATQSAA